MVQKVGFKLRLGSLGTGKLSVHPAVNVYQLESGKDKVTNEEEGPVCHMLCLSYNGSLTPTVAKATWLWEILNMVVIVNSL